jgi:hypothetical protein
MDVLQTKTDSA